MKIYSKTLPNKVIPTNKVVQEFVGDDRFSNKNPNFKGGMPKVSEVVKTFGEDFGESAGKYFDEIIKNSGLKINADDTITFEEQPFGKRALDILLYPIKDMPVDLANATINGLKKFPFLKNSSWLNDLSVKPFFQNRKNALENKSNIAAIQNYFEILEREKGAEGEFKRFAEAHKRLAPLMPNYNSETELSLNRIVTGLIPAFFLANDAYNLSIYMNNNKDEAGKEKKRRFNQEVARIGITATATFYLMSIFSKQCNKSIPLTAGITAGIVLVSEVVGRLMAGNPVLPVSTEKTKEYSEKRNKIKQNDNSRPVPQNNEEKAETSSKPAQKGFLTLSNVLKVLGGLVAFGFAVDKISNFPKISKKIGKFNDWYKGLFTDEFTIKRERFNELMDKLDTNGFGKMAERYGLSINNPENKILTIGNEQNKWKYVLIHQILTFPVRFVKDVALLPYKKIVKPLSNIVKEKILRMEIKKPPKASSKFEASKEIQMLQNSIKFLEKIEHDESEEFTRKVNEKLVSSFDNLTKSNYKNSDLNVTVKTAASAVTTGFLIADNYNMVMIDSQGKDKNLAEQKAKERAIQRGARLTYEAFILKMVLDMFAGICSASLAGSLAVSGVLRVITEMFERKAVGLPIGESNQEEIKENETKHLQATGLKGSYFRAMAELTGKKSFNEKQKNNKKS